MSSVVETIATIASIIVIAICSVRQRWNWIPSSGQSARTGGAQGAGPTTPAKKGPTIIIFVVGGMTFSEMRAAYEAAEATDHHVIIGKKRVGVWTN